MNAINISKLQTARIQDVNGICYVVDCEASQSDQEVLASAAKFYGRDMATVQGRRFVREAY